MRGLVRAHLIFVEFEGWLTCVQGDPQSALGQYGDVLLLLQLCIARYEVGISPCPCFSLTIYSCLQLRSGVFKHGGRILDASYLTSSWAVYNLADLADTESTLVNDWVRAVFDSNSVGIDDNILR